MARSCIHELDVVALAHPASGYGPEGGVVTVAAGTTGTVVREQAGSPWVEVEIADAATGMPRAFVEVERPALRLVRRLDRTAA